MNGHLIFIARVPPHIQQAILAMLAMHGLDRRLGDALFAAVNWHQSLSDKYPPSEMESMLRAGARIRAQAFEMVFNRIRSSGQDRDIHWALRPRGNPIGLLDLFADVRASLIAEGITVGTGHSGHITLSYWAPEPLMGTVNIDPISWLVDSFELVQISGRPDRYTTLERWSLATPAQACIF